VKGWSGSGESELSNLDGASRILIFFTSESSDENISKLPKTEVSQGLSVPSSPISPAAAICVSAEDGMMPEEARTANAIGKSYAVEVLERSAGARFTVIALPGQRWPQAISADLILVAEALAAWLLIPEIRNKTPLSSLNSTRTKEGEPGEPANPKVDTIMART